MPLIIIGTPMVWLAGQNGAMGVAGMVLVVAGVARGTGQLLVLINRRLAPDRRAWRSGLWNSALVVGMLVFLVILPPTLVRPLPPDTPVLLTVRLKALFAAGVIFCSVGLVKALRMGIVATPEEVIAREWFTTEKVPWANIEAVTCKETGGWLVFPLYAPILTYRRPAQDGTTETIASALLSVASPARFGLLQRRSVAFRAAAGLAELLARYQSGHTGATDDTTSGSAPTTA